MDVRADDEARLVPLATTPAARPDDLVLTAMAQRANVAATLGRREPSTLIDRGPRAAPAAPEAPPLRIGVVGLGAVAQAVHLPLLAKRPDLFAPAAVCDVSRSTRTSIGARAGLAEEQQFASAEEMLAGAELDAVAVLTSGSHGALAAAAARAGLAVFCEKPLAYTLAEADELAALEPRLMLGYMKLYDPAVEHARRLLADRPAPRSVEVTVLHPSSAAQLAHAGLLPAPSDVDPAVRTAFAAAESAVVERALGPVPGALATLYTEVLLGSVVHDLAVLRYLLGGPLEVHDVEAWPEETAEGSLALTGSLPGGARVSIRWHYLEDYPAYREEVRVHDERGTVALEFPSPYLLHAPTVLTVDDTDDGLARSATFRSTAEAFERQWLAFARFALDGVPPRAGIAEGRADIVACQQAAARLAARSDLPIGGEADVQVAAMDGSADRPAAVGDEQITGAEATKEGKS